MYLRKSSDCDGGDGGRGMERGIIREADPAGGAAASVHSPQGTDAGQPA